jgi:hypothetical protein
VSTRDNNGASAPPSIALIVPETIAQFRDTQNSCSSVL